MRKLLIHGARGVMSRLNRSKHRLAAWLTEFEARSHLNIAAVALANKLARIAWALLTNEKLSSSLSSRPVTASDIVSKNSQSARS